MIIYFNNLSSDFKIIINIFITNFNKYLIFFIPSERLLNLNCDGVSTNNIHFFSPFSLSATRKEENLRAWIESETQMCCCELPRTRELPSLRQLEELAESDIFSPIRLFDQNKWLISEKKSAGSVYHETLIALSAPENQHLLASPESFRSKKSPYVICNSRENFGKERAIRVTDNMERKKGKTWNVDCRRRKPTPVPLYIEMTSKIIQCVRDTPRCAPNSSQPHTGLWAPSRYTS